MSEIKIKKNYIQFEGHNYFRDDASAQRIAAYGQKRGAATTGNARLDPEGRIARANFASKVRHLRTIQVDWERETKAEVDGNGVFKYFGLDFKSAQTFDFEKAKSLKLVLELFAIDEEPLKAILNNGATAAIDYLRKEGKDGRVVSRVMVATTAELSEHFKTAVSLSASVSQDSDEIELVVSGGRSGTQTVKLDQGTFAYSLHKVSDWSKGKEKIDDLTADYHG